MRNCRELIARFLKTTCSRSIFLRQWFINYSCRPFYAIPKSCFTLFPATARIHRRFLLRFLSRQKWKWICRSKSVVVNLSKRFLDRKPSVALFLAIPIITLTHILSIFTLKPKWRCRLISKMQQKRAQMFVKWKLKLVLLSAEIAKTLPAVRKQ